MKLEFKMMRIRCFSTLDQHIIGAFRSSSTLLAAFRSFLLLLHPSRSFSTLLDPFLAAFGPREPKMGLLPQDKDIVDSGCCWTPRAQDGAEAPRWAHSGAFDAQDEHILAAFRYRRCPGLAHHRCFWVKSAAFRRDRVLMD